MKKKPLVVTATAVFVANAGLVWLTHPTYCPTKELVPPPTPMNAALGYDGSSLNCVCPENVVEFSRTEFQTFVEGSLTWKLNCYSVLGEAPTTLRIRRSEYPSCVMNG